MENAGYTFHLRREEKDKAIVAQFLKKGKEEKQAKEAHRQTASFIMTTAWF